MGVVAVLVAGGHGVAPAKPTFTHSGGGIFTVSNPSGVSYYVVSNSSAVITGNQISLAYNVNSSTTVWSYNNKGLFSGGTIIERKKQEYTPDTRWGPVHHNIGECGPGPDCSCYGSPWGPHWDNDPVLGSVNPHCSWDEYGGSAPALIDAPGYTNSHSEWIKIT